MGCGVLALWLFSLLTSTACYRLMQRQFTEQSNPPIIMSHRSLRRLVYAAALLAPALALQAATHYVTLGESIQTKVDAATAGDTIIIFGGSYGENVTIGKQLTLQRVAGESVFITGSVTYQNITAAAATPLIISNLKIGGDSGKRLTLNNCTNVTLENLDLAIGGLVVNNTSNVVVETTALGVFTGDSNARIWVGNSTAVSADMVKTELTLSRVKATGLVRMKNSDVGFTTRALNLLQCTLTNGTGNCVEVNGGKARLLYSKLSWTHLYHASSDAVILGNTFKYGGRHPGGAIVVREGKAVIRNNEITIPGGGGEGREGSGIAGDAWNNGIFVESCDALIANNYTHDFGGFPNGYDGDNDRNGVFVANVSITKPVRIYGNIFGTGMRRPVYGPFGVDYSRNNDVPGVNGHAGGVISDNNIGGSPLFVNSATGDYRLGVGSPCINAGPTFAWLNDRDTTRNDIGLFGGAAYDPEGTTTSKPITFLLQGTPLTVIKGVHPTLNISGGGIVVGR